MMNYSIVFLIDYLRFSWRIGFNWCDHIYFKSSRKEPSDEEISLLKIIFVKLCNFRESSENLFDSWEKSHYVRAILGRRSTEWTQSMERQASGVFCMKASSPSKDTFLRWASSITVLQNGCMSSLNDAILYSKKEFHLTSEMFRG